MSKKKENAHNIPLFNIKHDFQEFFLSFENHCVEQYRFETSQIRKFWYFQR